MDCIGLNWIELDWIAVAVADDVVVAVVVAVDVVIDVASQKEKTRKIGGCHLVTAPKPGKLKLIRRAGISQPEAKSCE